MCSSSRFTFRTNAKSIFKTQHNIRVSKAFNDGVICIKRVGTNNLAAHRAKKDPCSPKIFCSRGSRFAICRAFGSIFIIKI